MTDEQMDARLRSAGERWRSGPAVSEDPRGEAAELLPPPPSRPHRVLAMVSAAAVVIALVLGGVLFAAYRGSDTSPTAAGDPSTPAAGDPTRVLRGVTWTDRAGDATLVFLKGAVRIHEQPCLDETRSLNVSGSTVSLGRPAGYGSVCGGGGFSVSERHTSRFDDVLRHGPFTWSLTAGTLRISAHGTSIMFTSDGARPPGLVSQTWVLELVTDPSGKTHEAAASAKLTFDGANRFTASDTCNGLNGSVRATPTTITFGNVSMTDKYCAFAKGSVIPVADKLLHGTTRYEIRGNELILSRPHYEGLLVYRAK